jgi:hypothetical protein
MVQAGEKGGPENWKLESIINWEAVDRSLVEIEADKVVAAIIESSPSPFRWIVHIYFGRKKLHFAASTTLTNSISIQT